VVEGSWDEEEERLEEVDRRGTGGVVWGRGVEEDFGEFREEEEPCCLCIVEAVVGVVSRDEKEEDSSEEDEIEGSGRF
jgi:hypothetical protein